MRARTTLRTASIEDLLRDLVREELARVLGSVAGPIYSTSDVATFPPGKRTHRAARDSIRVVPGAVRTGVGKATVWSCTVDAYRLHHARAASPVRVVPAPVADDDALAEAALSGAGLRKTRCAS